MAPPPCSDPKNRDDFPAALARARSALAARSAADPRSSPWAKVLRRLARIAGWTANGRVPTPGERVGITVGTLVVRELEPIEDVGELQYDFQTHYGHGSRRR